MYASGISSSIMSLSTLLVALSNDMPLRVAVILLIMFELRRLPNPILIPSSPASLGLILIISFLAFLAVVLIPTAVRPLATTLGIGTPAKIALNISSIGSTTPSKPVEVTLRAVVAT